MHLVNRKDSLLCYNQSMHIFLFFILGLAVGSFLNVLVYRLKDGETLLGRSYCRHCKHQIRWYDNVPLLSFLVLGGKCRDCKERLSWQYPLLESATGIGFVLVGNFFFVLEDQMTWIETGWLLGIVALFLAIAAYDLINMEIPLSLLVASALWTGVFLLMTLYMESLPRELWWEARLAQGVLGGGVIALFFFALVYASKETWMGWGDVWLGGVAGMIVGLPAALLMLTLSFGFGALFGLGMIAFHKKGMKSQIPFAPYLVLGTLLTLFLPKMLPQLIGQILL